MEGSQFPNLMNMVFKPEKYQPLINDIKTLGWNVDPLIVLVAGARATTFEPSMTSLDDNFNISLKQMKKTFTIINTIAIQYAMKILLTKRKLETTKHSPISLRTPKHAF